MKNDKIFLSIMLNIDKKEISQKLFLKQNVMVTIKPTFPFPILSSCEGGNT